MQVTRDFTIAVHILLCIEFFKDKEKVTSEFISGSVGVNSVIIRNIIAKLKSAGLVMSRQGVSGMTLSKPVDKITLFDIYKAVGADEKPIINFHENSNPKCPVGGNIHAVLDSCIEEATSALENNLKTKNLSDLLEDIKKLQGE